MNVIHIVPALFQGDDGIVGGAERYVLELARHMAAVVPTRLVTFGSRHCEKHLDDLRIRVIGNPWLVRGERSNPFALRLLDELGDADVIHCHQPHVLSSSVAAVVAQLRGQRIYCTDLGGGGWDISSYMSTDRLYDGHLHISEYSRRIASHAGKAWAYVILGGVDTAKFSPPEEQPTTANRPVLFVGRLLPHKGVDDLVRALPADMCGEIIGPAPDARYLADLRAIAVGKQIVFRHDCNDEALVDGYRRALCVVLPSVYRTMYAQHTAVPELLGQTLLEAMACGAPVICTTVASLPEIVKDGVTGLVVPPNNPAELRSAIQWLRNHPEAGAAMGTAGRDWVLRQFTWPAVVARCLEIYRGSPRGASSLAVQKANVRGILAHPD